MLKKQIWASFQRIIELFTQKFVTAFKNMGLGSGIRKNLFPDPGPGVKKAPDPVDKKNIRGSRTNFTNSPRPLNDFLFF
jgi:hypothetical protein